ncbi:MAG: eL32 family ribosomal protein [Nanobdellota archaeon]
MKEQLKLRRSLKARKPSFRRHDSHKKDRVSSSWRRPKGRQNKCRLHKKGYVKAISSGYGSPKSVKGLSREGLVQCVIKNVSELSSLDPKKHGIIVSGKIGDRKRESIVNSASKEGFMLLNINSESFAKQLSKKLKSKSQKRSEVLKRRSAKKKKSKSSKKSSEDSKQSTESDSSKEKKSSSTKSVQPSSSTEKKSSKSTSSDVKKTDSDSSKKTSSGDQK